MIKNHDKFLCVKGNHCIEKGEVITIHNLSKCGNIAYSAGRMDKNGIEFCLNIVDDNNCVANFGNCKAKWNAYFVSIKSLLNDKVDKLAEYNDKIKDMAKMFERRSDNPFTPSQEYYQLLALTNEQHDIKCEILELINKL